MLDDQVIKKLLEHDERLSELVTKKEFATFRNELLNGQDKMIEILIRLDDERVFTVEWVKRIEREVEEQKNKTKEHEELLQRIKLQLQIA